MEKNANKDTHKMEYYNKELIDFIYVNLTVDDARKKIIESELGI